MVRAPSMIHCYQIHIAQYVLPRPHRAKDTHTHTLTDCSLGFGNLLFALFHVVTPCSWLFGGRPPSRSMPSAILRIQQSSAVVLSAFRWTSSCKSDCLTVGGSVRTVFTQSQNGDCENKRSQRQPVHGWQARTRRYGYPCLSLAVAVTTAIFLPFQHQQPPRINTGRVRWLLRWPRCL
jgi:hypothetical protein